MVKRLVILAGLGIGVLCLSSSTFAMTILDPEYQEEVYATYDFELGNHPAYDMTFDPQGNLYVTQYQDYASYDGRIYRIDTDQNVSIFAIGLTRPEDVIWCGQTEFGDCLYVTEGYDNAYNYKGGLTRVYSDGSIERFVTSGFNQPVSLAVDRDGYYGGKIYVGDSAGSDRICAVLPNGQVQGFFSFGSHSGAPIDISFAPEGSYGGLMYIAASYKSLPDLSGVLTFDPAGNPAKFVPDIDYAYDLAFDETEAGTFGNYLYAVTREWDGWCSSIYRIYPDGYAELFISDLQWQTRLAFGPDGALYVSESGWGDNTVVITRVESEMMAAMRNIHEALECKQQALDKIEEAMEKEEAAIQVFDQLGPHGSDALRPSEVAKAQARIRVSMAFERIAKHQLYKSMAGLRAALSILTGSDSAPAPLGKKAKELLEEEELRRADINQDGIVDELDYDILSEHWLKEIK